MAAALGAAAEAQGGRVTEVAMTVEHEPHGYGQNMITVERGNGGSVQCMILTDTEFQQLMAMGSTYLALESAQRASFEDASGRPPVIQEEHGAYGVVN